MRKLVALGGGVSAVVAILLLGLLLARAPQWLEAALVLLVALYLGGMFALSWWDGRQERKNERIKALQRHPVSK